MDVRKRQDDLLRLMRRQEHATVQELADQVEVSRRTILRDLAGLRARGFVIHSDSGRGGGVSLDRNSTQLIAKLNVDEVFALLVSLAVAQASNTSPLAGLADRAMAKLEHALPSERLRDFREITGRFYVGLPATDHAVRSASVIDDDLLPVFERAFLGRRRLRFSYLDVRGVVSQRDVEPQALLVFPPICHLVAWDIAKGAFRNFRMDRIGKAELVEGSRFAVRQVRFDAGVCPFSSSALASAL
jgi:predicted DNA-binding transcriptional regulator YafY